VQKQEIRFLGNRKTQIVVYLATLLFISINPKLSGQEIINNRAPDSSRIQKHFQKTDSLIAERQFEAAIKFLDSIKQKLITDTSNYNPYMIKWNYYAGVVYQKLINKQEALEYFLRAWRGLAETPTDDSEFLGELSLGLGKAYLGLMDSKNAFSYLFKSLEIWKINLPKYDENLQENYNLIAETYDILYKMDSAKIYLDSAMMLMQNPDQENTRLSSMVYTNLIINFLKTGKRDTAVYYIKKNIEICRNYTYDKDTESHMYMLLGIVHSSKAEYEKSIYFFKKDIHIIDSIYGKFHINTAGSRGNLGIQYEHLSDIDSASKYYHEALKIRMREYPADDPRIANSFMNIGNLYWEAAKLRIALDYYKKAANIYQNKYGSDHHLLERSYSNMGSCYLNLKEYDKAQMYFQKSMDIGYSNTTLISLGFVYANLKQFDTAIYCIEKSIREREAGSNTPTTRIASGYQQLGLVYKKMNDSLNTIKNYKKSIEIYQLAAGTKHIEIARNYSDIGDIYYRNELYDKAIHNYHQGLIAIATGFLV